MHRKSTRLVYQLVTSQLDQLEAVTAVKRLGFTSDLQLRARARSPQLEVHQRTRGPAPHKVQGRCYFLKWFW